MSNEMATEEINSHPTTEQNLQAAETEAAELSENDLDQVAGGVVKKNNAGPVIIGHTSHFDERDPMDFLELQR